MNKTTNYYRKCPYCPHHSQTKPCCCRTESRPISTKSGKRLKHNRNKSKKNQTINQSTISYVNNTLPIPTVPNLFVENSNLRTENDYLKKQLQSQFQNISVFTKDDANMTTLPSSENQSSRNLLHEKLYLSNKNLQETLMDMDTLSKKNSELHESNKKLQIQIQQLRIQHEEDVEMLRRLKKKNKKYLQMVDNFPTQTDVQKIVQVNTQLQGENTYLREQIEELRERLLNKKSQKDGENLSPEWVAHTSTKINVIQKNIAKLEGQNKPENLFNKDIEIESEKLKALKSQIVLAIKEVKISSKTFQSYSALEDMLNSSSISLITLIKTLCQSLMEPVMQRQVLLEKEINRKLMSYENKFLKVVQKMQNMTLKVQNDRLRSKSLTKRHL